jgi:uncharacterized membrane protein
VKYEVNSGLAVRAWTCGVWRSSVKMKVFGAEVARVTRSAAARGEVADFESARKGYGNVCIDMSVIVERGFVYHQGSHTSKAFNALVCSMVLSVAFYFLKRDGRLWITFWRGCRMPRRQGVEKDLDLIGEADDLAKRE